MTNHFIKLIGITFVFWVVTCCTDQKKTKKPESQLVENKNKPPSSFFDTLKINSRSAVFYNPDSIQLEKIKAVTEKNIYEGSMHEYFYQVRNAHIALKKYWPAIKIFEAKNVRYLQFVKGDQTNEIIDLNTKNDAYGLFVFDPYEVPDTARAHKCRKRNRLLLFYYKSTKKK
jgi:hypothetical protein